MAVKKLRTDRIPYIPRQVAHMRKPHNDLSISRTFPHFYQFTFPEEMSLLLGTPRSPDDINIFVERCWDTICNIFNN